MEETNVKRRRLDKNGAFRAQVKEITEDENALLTSEHWYRKDHYNWFEGTPKVEKCREEEFLNYSLNVIREAYLSTRETSSDIMHILSDDTAMGALFHLAFCMRRLKEFSSRLGALRTILVTKIEASGRSTGDVIIKDAGLGVPAVSVRPSDGKLKSSADPRELENCGKDKCLLCSLTHMKNTVFIGHTQILNGLEKILLDIAEEIIKLSGKPQIEEANNISQQIYYMLLILKEILSKMGIHPTTSFGKNKDMKKPNEADRQKEAIAGEKLCIKCRSPCSSAPDEDVLKLVDESVSIMEDGVRLVDHHFKSFQNKLQTRGLYQQYFVDNKAAKLMNDVEDGVSQLWTAIARKESLLTELIDSVYESFAPDTDEYSVGCACDQRRFELNEKLQLDLSRSTGFLSSAPHLRCIYVAFQKVIELIDPCGKWPVWYSDHQRLVLESTGLNLRLR